MRDRRQSNYFHQPANAGFFTPARKKPLMKNFTNMEVTSYAGSVSSIGAALTFTDIGVIVGIITALVTCLINTLYVIRKDRREERALQAQLGERP